MKKIFALLLALLLGAGLFAGCGAKAETLVLYTWEGMFPKEVLDGFEKQTGIKVNYNTFDTDETMLARLEDAKGGEFDLIIADDYIIAEAIKKNLVQKLDKTKLTAYGNIDPAFQGQFFDPQNDYTVPYGAGVQTIAYNPALVEKDITGYADLLDPSLKNNVGVIANYRVVNGLALKILGKSYNTEDLSEIQAAGEKLLELAPNIRLIKDDNLQDDLISGEVAAAVMYTSQVTMAKLAKPDLKVVFPKEGIGFGIMAQFIPANAPNSAAAHKFIDYILNPEVAAQCFTSLGYYVTNKACVPLIAEEYRAFLTLPEGISGNMEMIGTISTAAMDEHAAVWNAFKNAAGKS